LKFLNGVADLFHVQSAHEKSTVKIMDAFRQAVEELGHTSAEDLANFIESRYGKKIDPQYVPLFRACLQDLERLNNQKAKAQIIDESDVPSSAREDFGPGSKCRFFG
jgi:hypothetical protein